MQFKSPVNNSKLKRHQKPYKANHYDAIIRNASKRSVYDILKQSIQNNENKKLNIASSLAQAKYYNKIKKSKREEKIRGIRQ